MSDFKTKLPDLKELSSMASKLFKDIKTSICEIAKEYKEKREEPVAPAEAAKKDDVISSTKKTTRSKPPKKEKPDADEP